MSESPILDELHAIREQMWKDAGGTYEGLFRMIRTQQQEHPERLVDLSDRGKGKSKVSKQPPSKPKKPAKSR